MKIKTINEQWNQFKALVISPDADEVQVRECKRMFFAGFAAAYDTMVNEIPKISDDEGFVILGSLYQQIKGFNEAIKLGAA